MSDLTPEHERGLRRELLMARRTRPHAVPAILRELGEAPANARETRGGATSDKQGTKKTAAKKDA
jgi:hypothetical protein